MTRLPSLGPRGEGWVAIQLLLLLLVAVAGLLAGDAWRGVAAMMTALLGLGLIAAGALLAGRGLLDLGRNLTPLPHPRPGAELVEGGIFARVRHPIYGGLILGAFGWGLATASPLALLLALSLAGFFRLKAGREEAWLEQHHAGYRDYAARTRRFVPGVY